MKGLVFSAAFLLALPAAAKPERDIRNTTGMSVNLLGLQNATDVSFSWLNLYDSDNALLEGAHLSLGFTNKLTPGFERLGAWLEFSPLSVLDFRVGADSTGYFGTFGSIIGFQDYTDAFDEDDRDVREAEGQPAFAVRAYANPTAKIKVGPIIAAASAEFEFWTMPNAPGPFFYEPCRDTLIRSEGDAFMTLSSVLLYEANFTGGKQLRAGASYFMLNPFDPTADGNTQQTLGALAVYTIGDKALGLYRPQVIATGFMYLQDRFKQGEIGAQAAFRFFLNPDPTKKVAPPEPLPPLPPLPASVPASEPASTPASSPVEPSVQP
jgi:hypothetical protein